MEILKKYLWKIEKFWKNLKNMAEDLKKFQII